MSARVRRFRRTGGLLAPLLTLALLAGCGAAGTASGATSAAATAQPTVTSASLPALPTTTVASGACGQHFPDTAMLTPAHGLVVTQYTGLGDTRHLKVRIPSSQPAAPMSPPAFTLPDSWAANTTPIVDPVLREDGGGYIIAICNPSGQPHIISAVQVTLAKMTPFTDQLGAWTLCTGTYRPLGGQISGDCSAGDMEDELMHAPFAADAPVGAAVTATQTASGISGMSGGANFGPLPVTLQPGRAMTIEVGVTQPSAPGYYTYSFALTVDGASTGAVTYSLTSLLAPVARAWSGVACTASAMQALIAKEPTPTASTAYICPKS